MSNRSFQFVPSEDDALAVDSLCKSLGMSPQEALAKGVISESGVFFEKKGKEIKAALEKKIAPLKTEYTKLCGELGIDPASFKMKEVASSKANATVEGEATPVPDFSSDAVECPSSSPVPMGGGVVGDPLDPMIVLRGNSQVYQANSLRYQIESADQIVRNIDVKKTFKLSQWQLSEFGL